MSIANNSLIDLQHTGFACDKNIMSQGTGGENDQTIYQTIVRVIVAGSLFLGTGSSLYNQWLGQEETTITEAQLQQRFIADFSNVGTAEIQNSYEQIEHLKISMGLNILDLAAILHVSRPTIYDWIDSRKTTIHKKNQKRLNLVYEISKIWKARQIGQLGSYLHKPIGATNLSLFTLLKNDNLDYEKIKSYLDNIATTIVNKRRRDEAHEELLKEHGFELISKEDMEERLNDIYFSS
jgi:hypothetical protein